MPIDQAGSKDINYVVSQHATRGTEELRVEVKGDTGANAGLEPTRCTGMLRHMEDRPGVTYAVVGPTRSVKAMLRVPAFVRERLKIRVFEVTTAGEVVEHAGDDADKTEPHAA